MAVLSDTLMNIWKVSRINKNCRRKIYELKPSAELNSW